MKAIRITEHARHRKVVKILEAGEPAKTFASIPRLERRVQSVKRVAVALVKADAIILYNEAIHWRDAIKEINLPVSQDCDPDEATGILHLLDRLDSVDDEFNDWRVNSRPRADVLNRTLDIDTAHAFLSLMDVASKLRVPDPHGQQGGMAMQP